MPELTVSDLNKKLIVANEFLNQQLNNLSAAKENQEEILRNLEENEINLRMSTIDLEKKIQLYEKDPRFMKYKNEYESGKHLMSTGKALTEYYKIQEQVEKNSKKLDELEIDFSTYAIGLEIIDKKISNSTQQRTDIKKLEKDLDDLFQHKLTQKAVDLSETVRNMDWQSKALHFFSKVLEMLRHPTHQEKWVLLNNEKKLDEAYNDRQQKIAELTQKIDEEVKTFEGTYDIKIEDLKSDESNIDDELTNESSTFRP